MNASSPHRPLLSSSLARKTLCVCLGLLLAYLGWVALRLRVDYFDSYETFLNSRLLAGSGAGPYYWKRPHLFSLLLTPAFLAESLSKIDGSGFVISHLLAICFFAGFLWISYRLFRLFASPPWSSFGVFLLALNPLLVHFAPFAKEDIASAALMTATFFFYLKAERKPGVRNYWLAGLFMTLAGLSRFHFLPIILLILWAHETWQMISRPAGRAANAKRLPVKFYALGLAPVALFLLFIICFYTALKLAPARQALESFFTEFLVIMALNTEKQPAILNYLFLLYSLSLPLAVFAIIGAALDWREHVQNRTFILMWAGLFFLFQTYAISVKESRYLFPIFPPLYLWIVIASRSAWNYCFKQPNSPRLRWIGILLIAVLTTTALARGIKECKKFRDPFYSSDMPGAVSHYAKSLAGPHSIFWIGPYYAQHPKDFVFHPEDKITYIYHLYKHVVQFYAQRPVNALADAQFQDSLPGESAVFVGPNIRQLAKDGDVLIINREPSLYITGTIPSSMKPLLVERVKELKFLRAGKTPEGADHFLSTELPGADVTGSVGADGLALVGAGIPDGHYEVYLQIPLVPSPVPLGFANVRNGSFELIENKLTRGIPIAEVSLLHYDAVRTFPSETSQDLTL